MSCDKQIHHLKKNCLIAFLGCCSILIGQNKPLSCLDVGIGITNVKSDPSKFYNNYNDNVGQKYISLPLIQLKDYESRITHVSGPYVHVGLELRYNRFYELVLRGSYSQFRNDISYYDFESGQVSATSYYPRVITEAYGKLITNRIILSAVPALRICNTKIIFGIVNANILLSNAKFDGDNVEYNVINKNPVSSFGTQDSVATQVSRDKFSRKYSAAKFYLPLSIGVEQEIPFKKYRYVVGVTLIHSKNHFPSTSFIGYIGMRFSKPYTWRKS